MERDLPAIVGLLLVCWVVIGYVVRQLVLQRRALTQRRLFEQEETALRQRYVLGEMDLPTFLAALDRLHATHRGSDSSHHTTT